MTATELAPAPAPPTWHPRLQSENIAEFAAALAKAQGQISNATLNRTNPHFKSKYADLASVLDAIRKPLSDNGLAAIQQIDIDDATRMVLRTTLVHASGQWVATEYPLPTTGRPQEIGSLLTYARRYSLTALVCTAADDDDDAEGAESRGQKVGGVRTPKPPAPNVMHQVPHNAETSEIKPGQEGEETDAERIHRLDGVLMDAAEAGMQALQDVWETIDPEDRKQLKAALERRHKPRAAAVDKANATAAT